MIFFIFEIDLVNNPLRQRLLKKISHVPKQESTYIDGKSQVPSLITVGQNRNVGRKRQIVGYFFIERLLLIF